MCCGIQYEAIKNVRLDSTCKRKMNYVAQLHNISPFCTQHKWSLLNITCSVYCLCSCVMFFRRRRCMPITHTPTSQQLLVTWSLFTLFIKRLLPDTICTTFLSFSLDGVFLSSCKQNTVKYLNSYFLLEIHQSWTKSSFWIVILASFQLLK